MGDLEGIGEKFEVLFFLDTFLRVVIY